MPDRRTHRGPHPADGRLFAGDALADLRAAVADYSLLLTKGYAEKSALKLVGDRFSLTQRQRLAVMRSACSDQQLASRNERRIELKDIEDQPLDIDGYNVLITVEAAMSGGMIFQGRDGCFRDLASIHGTYRKVVETIPALQLIGECLQEIGATRTRWLLDSPVSNSGRLKSLIGELALKNDWDWQIELLQSPDAELKRTDAVIASTDSVILDACRKWTNLAAQIITRKLHSAIIVDLSVG
ncbi:MAG: DUF434 domain-containing protein [Sedimentisphaerales bacterium]